MRERGRSRRRRRGKEQREGGREVGAGSRGEKNIQWEGGRFLGQS